MTRNGVTSRRSGQGRKAAAMVEMAIVLPLLLILLLGIIEWGWIFFKISQVNNAARHGVRVAIRPSSTTSDVQNAVQTIMNGAGFREDQYTFVVSSVSVPAGTPITVTVSVPYSNIRLIGFTPTPETLHGSATMAREGPSS